jgi:cyclase
MTRLTRRSFVEMIAALGPALRYASGQTAPELAVQPLGDELALLTGAGGNIAVLHGAGGLLLVDSGIAAAAAALEARLRPMAPLGVKVLINTHHHIDHTGANLNFGRTGARIIAHENALRRLSAVQHSAFMGRDTQPLAIEARPNAPFADSGSLVHAGEKVSYRHLPPAHTDGDTTVRFEQANVYHTGDLFFHGIYPFIDYSAGGSIEGMIAAAGRILDAVDGATRIIPGHGPLATRDDLRAYRDMLSGIEERLTRLARQGKTLEEAQAAEPTKPWDEKWGNGFLKPALFVKMIWTGRAGRG